MATVLMTSAEYGTEEFDYDSEEEAYAGLARLQATADELDDGIERWYQVVESMEEEEEG